MALAEDSGLSTLTDNNEWSSDSSNFIAMPYLIYSPDSNDTTEPTYAVGRLDAVDEVVLQDLRKWGWRVEETTSDDSKWLTAIREYHARMKRPVENGEERMLSLWEYWRKEKARRLVEEGGKGGRKRNKLVKKKSGASSRSSVLGFGRRREVEKVPRSSGSPQHGDQGNEVKEENQRRRRVGEIRQQVEQTRASTTSQRATEQATRQLLELAPDGPPIFKYGNQTQTWAGACVQLDEELTREIVSWDGAGILKTTQVSVTSEEGITVDERGERVHFNPVPGWDLGLFPWDEDAERSKLTKSKASAPSNMDELKYVSGDFSEVFEVADKYQKQDKYD